MTGIRRPLAVLLCSAAIISLPALAQEALPLVKQLKNGNWLPQAEAESLRDELYYQQAMFDNRPTETQYFYTDNDGAGGQLTGSSNCEITFAAGQEPPVNGFWSLTLYNDKHLFQPNDLKRYSLGTKNKNLKRNADGSLTLHAGAKSPGGDKESN